MSIKSSFTLVPQANSSAFSYVHSSSHSLGNDNQQRPSLLVQALSTTGENSSYSRLIRGTILPNQRARRIQQHRQGTHNSDTTRAYAPFEPLISQRKMENGTISPLSPEEYHAWKERQSSIRPRESRVSDVLKEKAQQESRKRILAHVGDEAEGSTTFILPKVIRRANPFEPLVSDRNLENGRFSFTSLRQETTGESYFPNEQQYHEKENSWRLRCHRAEIAKCDARKQMLRIMDENRQLNIKIIYQKAEAFSDLQTETLDSSCDSNCQESVQEPKFAAVEDARENAQEKEKDNVEDHSSLILSTSRFSAATSNQSSSEGDGKQASDEEDANESCQDECSGDIDAQSSASALNQEEAENSALLACGKSIAKMNESDVTNLSSPKRKRLSFTEASEATESAVEAVQEEDGEQTVKETSESINVANNTPQEDDQSNKHEILELHEGSLNALDISAITAASASPSDAKAELGHSEESEPSNKSDANMKKNSDQLTDSAVEVSAEQTHSDKDAAEEDTSQILEVALADRLSAEVAKDSPPIRVTRSRATGLPTEFPGTTSEANNEGSQSSPFLMACKETSFEALSSSIPGSLQDMTNDLSSIGSNDDADNEEKSISTEVPAVDGIEQKRKEQDELTGSDSGDKSKQDSTKLQSILSPPLTRFCKKKRKSVSFRGDGTTEEAVQTGSSRKKAQSVDSEDEKMEDNEDIINFSRPAARKTNPDNSQENASKAKEKEKEESGPLASSLTTKASDKVTRRGRRRRGTIVDNLQAPVIKKTRRQTVRR